MERSFSCDTNQSFETSSAESPACYPHHDSINSDWRSTQSTAQDWLAVKSHFAWTLQCCESICLSASLALALLDDSSSRWHQSQQKTYVSHHQLLSHSIARLGFTHRSQLFKVFEGLIEGLLVLEVLWHFQRVGFRGCHACHSKFLPSRLASWLASSPANNLCVMTQKTWRNCCLASQVSAPSMATASSNAFQAFSDYSPLLRILSRKLPTPPHTLLRLGTTMSLPNVWCHGGWSRYVETCQTCRCFQCCYCVY